MSDANDFFYFFPLFLRRMKAVGFNVFQNSAVVGMQFAQREYAIFNNYSMSPRWI